MAMKDAAFEAYVALHKAGLVNDNLLPSRKEADDQAAEFQITDNTPSLINVSVVLDPWIAAIKNQQEYPQTFHRTLLTLERPGHEPCFMVLLTPVAMTENPQLTLYWNSTCKYSVRHSWLPSANLTKEEVYLMQAITEKILRSVFSSRMDENRRDFQWLIVPSDSSESMWSREQLCAWYESVDGHRLASDLIDQGKTDISSWGLISMEGDMRKFIPQGLLVSSGSTTSLDSYVQAIRCPKRRDFLHSVEKQNDANDAYTRVEEFIASKCVVQNLPASYAVFALLVPSIMYRYETHMIAETLRSTLLASVSLSQSQRSMVLQALTSSVTGEESNYQR